AFARRPPPRRPDRARRSRAAPVPAPAHSARRPGRRAHRLPPRDRAPAALIASARGGGRRQGAAAGLRAAGRRAAEKRLRRARRTTATPAAPTAAPIAAPASTSVG